MRYIREPLAYIFMMTITLMNTLNTLNIVKETYVNHLSFSVMYIASFAVGIKLFIGTPKLTFLLDSVNKSQHNYTLHYFIFPYLVHYVQCLFLYKPTIIMRLII